MSARLQIHQIPDFLARYNGDHDGEDDDLVARSERIRRERKMQLADLCAVCDWKAPRAAGHARKNTNTEVEEITALALGAKRAPFPRAREARPRNVRTNSDTGTAYFCANPTNR